MQLHDLEFTDIYLGKTASWLAGVPFKGDPIAAPVEVHDDLLELRRICEEIADSKQKQEFAVRFQEVAYRASTIVTLSETVYVLRRLPSAVPALSTLGLHPGYISRLLETGMTGLVVIAGAYGQGKTTTASSIITARLGQQGGVAVTIEDPPEMPLEGRHGEGVCYQTWVDQGGFGQACRQAARWAPSIIFVGEVRDGETAAEALRASINGRLVICTTHSDNAIMAIERIYSLACSTISNGDDVASLLANGLAAVIHQRLEGEPRRMRTECLWLRGDDHVGARNTIKAKRWSQLASDIQAQANQLLLSAARASA